MYKKFLSLAFILVMVLGVFAPLAQATGTQFTTVGIGTHYYQHHTWYSQGRFWVLYSDGADSVYQSSIDGITWTAKVVFRAGNAYTQRCNVALNADGTTIHMVSKDGVGWFYRMGTCNSDGTITWAGGGSSYAIDTSEVCITLDSSGYPYILYNRSPESAWYSQRSTTKNGVFTLGAEGVRFVASIAGGDVEGNTMKLPAQGMYSIYTLQHTSGPLYGKLENPVTHVWGAEELITATSVSAYDFSMVSDGTIIYLAYRDSITGHTFLYIRSSTGIWTNLGDISSEIIVGVPSLIQDQTYGGAWIFWSNVARNIKTIHVSPIGVLQDVRTIKYCGVPVVETGLLGLEIMAITGDSNHVGIIYPTASGTSFDLLHIYSDFLITNMEGSDSTGTGLKLLEVENKFYYFELTIVGISSDPVDYASVRFYNNGHLIQVDYNVTTLLTKIVSGNDYIILHEVQTSTVGDVITIKWDVWLKSSCVDTENTDIETYFSLDSGADFGWDMYTDYCDIYNLGGWVSSSVSGTATVTCTTATVQTTTITTSTNTFYTTSLTTSPNTITTTSLSTRTTTTPLSATTTSITTTTNITCETLQVTTISSTSIKTTSPTTMITTTLTSITTSTTVYTTSSTSSTAITTTKTTNSISIGDAGRITGGDIFDIYANRNSGIKAHIAFRNLQNVHALVTLYADSFSAWSGFASDVVPIEFGINYWTGTAFVTGWSVKLDLVAATATDSLASLNWKVDWYYNGVLSKSEYLNTFPIVEDNLLGGLNKPSYTTILVDMWYNKMNSSSVIGGRVTTEYYAVKATTAWWLQWLLGNNWGIVTGTTYGPQSLFFHDLEDVSGTIISAKDIEMSYFWAKISQGNSAGTARYEIKDWNVMDFGIVDDMIGINTPAYMEPKIHYMAQGGFLNSLWASLQQSLTGLLTAIGGVFGALGNASYHFVDTILAYFGLSGAFNSFTTIITDLWTNLMVMVLSFIDMTISLMGLIYAVFGFVFYGFTSFVSIILSLFNLVIGIINGTGSVATGLGDIWAKLNLAVGFPLIIIIMLVQYFGRKDEQNLTAGEYIRQVYEDARILLGISLGMFEFVWNVLSNIVLRIIEFIRGMMPVV